MTSIIIYIYVALYYQHSIYSKGGVELKKWLCLFTIIFLTTTTLVACGNNENKENENSTIEQLITSVNDGTYRGIGEGFKGDITIDVVVEDGKIIAIEIIEESETKDIAGPAFEEIPKRIIDSQSSTIDVYSGATYASKGIIEAVENALTSANK